MKKWTSVRTKEKAMHFETMLTIASPARCKPSPAWEVFHQENQPTRDAIPYGIENEQEVTREVDQKKNNEKEKTKRWPGKYLSTV